MDKLGMLSEIERKLLWLSSWMIYWANHERPQRDGTKVGGHQASCASSVTLLTALLLDALRPEDRIAIKPHAGPVLHALSYLTGDVPVDHLKRFRSLGGPQAYPSRTKDTIPVDFSTGSVGLGAALTCFASLAQDYLLQHGFLPQGRSPGRMVALVGDAELDEGNVYEMLREGWKQDVRNVWWVVDYNRQSLDAVVPDEMFRSIGRTFRAFGWNVIVLKYGARMEQAFRLPGGEALRSWINGCPNDLYAALSFEGGCAWREQILRDTGGREGLGDLLARYDDLQMHELMTNLGGHDLGRILDAFAWVRDDTPTCFLAYTIKGYGLPIAGHKDNHSSVMTPSQMETLRERMGIERGREWERAAGLRCGEEELDRFFRSVPRLRRPEPQRQPVVPVPEELAARGGGQASTQQAFGRLLLQLAREHGPTADRVVTLSPDVTVSTGLGSWVNERGVFGRTPHADVFQSRRLASGQRWSRDARGQHVELGIAETNLFLALAAFGMCQDLLGERVLPIGSVYDPFVQRGLDALNYACYQDARFILVGTPSGITLAHEGGAHQSIGTPLIAMSQCGLTGFEPAFADEVAEILPWSLGHIQDPDGGSVYIRLSTKALDQPERRLDGELKRQVVQGGYWLVPPAEGTRIGIVFSGAVADEVLLAAGRLGQRMPAIAVLNVTSADRLHQGWREAESARRRGRAMGCHVEDLLAPLDRDVRLITILDGHPAALSWLGAVRGHRIEALGVDSFGQCGDLPDLYRRYGIDAEEIEAAALRSRAP